MVESKRRPRKLKLLESITGADALAILKVLAKRDTHLAQEIETVAQALLTHVKMDDVAADVQTALASLDIEEVWDRAGPKRDGYVDPGDAAWAMYEDALQPFQDSVYKYQKLSMQEEAELTCQGILKGIYKFDTESATAYKEQEAVDASGEYFGVILDDWKALFQKRPPYSRLKAFLQTHCPDYADWGMKYLRSRKP